MNIVRKIHDLFRVKTVAGAQLETPEAVSSLGAGGSTFITIAGGGASLSGSGLSELDRVKLDSIELGALVNLDAFSKIQFDATSIDENDLSSSSNSSIIANVPTDTANIKIVGNYPITVNLESVSLFNSNTSTTTGTAITTYNISFNDDNNIVIEYVSGTLLNVADVELIQVKHKEDILATYLLSDITYTTSDGTITSFTIPYSNTDFSEIEFCKYETITTETETGSTTVRELRVLSTLPASPTKQSIITLNSLTDSFWNYEEDENGNKFVWTDYNVYSTKDVSAYGRGTDLGDTYASNLYELKDVVLTNLSNNDLLIYNSSTSKWVNINKDLLGISAGLLHTLTISVNGVTQAVYNPASANASVNISTITLDEVTEYIDQKIDTKLDASEFFKWFTINYDSNNNVVSIQANFDFYSIEGVSAYGLGEGEEEPSYVSELGLLSDVILTNVALNNILLYDGNKWVNKPMSSIVVDAYTKSEIDTKLSSISSEISTLKSNVTNILSNVTTILNSISGITSDISTINATISDILTTLTGKLDKDDFFTWFTIIKNTSGEVVSILANFDFYSIGEVSAYGLGDIGGSGRTTLATLDDVSLSNLITNDMLAYNGSKWVNIPMSQVRGVTSWADLENKPTTLSGFGITDAYTASLVDSKIAVVSNKLDNFLTGSDTDTIINKWKELESFLAGYTLTLTLAELLSVKANSSVKISAGTGLTGGGDLTANRTISLATSGVTAGTYTKVTVDTYGRVTSGSTLSASDIPNLDWSKITSGKPTTLAGYGITDGVNSVTITGTGNAITAATITDHILTLNKGNTFLQQSIFDDLFEKVNIGTTASPVYAIKAKYHFYSVGEVSAYEFGDTSEGGAKTLAELLDVLLTSLSSEQILKYNGSKWINIPITEVKGATSWDEIENKPTTFIPSAHTHTVVDITDISTLTLQVNGSNLATFNGKANVTANIAVPTKLSQLTDDVVSGKYLPLTAGSANALTGNLFSTKSIVFNYNNGDSQMQVSPGTFSTGKNYFIQHLIRLNNSTAIANLAIYNSTEGEIEIRRKETATDGSVYANFLWLGLEGMSIGRQINTCRALNVPNTFEVAGLNFLIGSAESSWTSIQGAYFNWNKTDSKLTLNKAYYSSGYAYTDINFNVQGTITSSSTLSAPQFSAQSEGIYTNYRLYLPESSCNPSTITRPRFGRFDRAEGSAVLQLGTSNLFDIVDAAWSTTLLRVSSSAFTYKGTAVSLNGHTHSYLPLSGGTMTGVITLTSGSNAAYDKTALSFIRSSNKSEQARIGTDSSNGLGLYANGIIYIRPNVTLGSSSTNGLVISSSSFTYNGTAVSLAGHTHNYLPLSGGTMTSGARISHDGNLYIGNSSNSGWVALQDICSQNSIGDGLWSIRTNGDAVFTTIKKVGSSDSYVLLGGGGHKLESSLSVANATNATVLLTSGMAQAADSCYDENVGLRFWKFNGTGNDIGGGDGYIMSWSWAVGSYGGQIYLDDNPSKTVAIRGRNLNKTFTTWSKFLHSDNYTDYTVTKTGTGASGTWGISISGNAASATKLQTARTLWGQSFDGTGNVSGNLMGAGGYIDMQYNDEINRYGGWLFLQHRGGTLTGQGTGGGTTTGHLVMCDNGGTVAIGTSDIESTYKAIIKGNVKVVNGVVLGYMYSTNSNAAAFVWDKPGSYYTGVGSDGTTDTIRFGACDTSGVWASYTQNWKFYGNAYATGAVTAKASSSDIRLKTDISDYKALSIIRNHRSIKYHWNEAAKANADIFNDNDWHFGLIAQEVQQDLPQMVSDVFKDYLVINYERLIPICWKGLQEVDDEVTKLKKRVKQLERRLLKYESTEVFYTKGND